jgi:hypothetical protein
LTWKIIFILDFLTWKKLIENTLSQIVARQSQCSLKKRWNWSCRWWVYQQFWPNNDELLLKLFIKDKLQLILSSHTLKKILNEKHELCQWSLKFFLSWIVEYNLKKKLEILWECAFTKNEDLYDPAPLPGPQILYVLFKMVLKLICLRLKTSSWNYIGICFNISKCPRFECFKKIKL